MKLVCVMTALLLVFPATGAASPALPGRAAALYQSAESPARESRTPAVVLGTKEERAAKAAANYAQNRSVEAALGFEGLWKDYPTDVDYLFNAAASRFAAGHNAHAVAYTREYLAKPSLTAEDRNEAEAQLREALPQVSPVAVTVTSAAGGPNAITVVAQHMARESGDLRPELLFPATAGPAMDLQLDPGIWTIRAQGPGYVTAEQRVEVIKGGKGVVALRLEIAPAAPTGGTAVPATPREVPPKLIRRLELGFGITGGLAAVTGIAVLAVGAGNVRKTSECTDESFGRCVQDLRNGVRVRDLGAMAFGGGVGLLTGGLTWLAKDPRKRRTAWIAEMVAGGAALVGGAILTTVSAGNFNTANDTGKFSNATDAEKTQLWSDHYGGNRHSVGHAMGGFLFGMGAGLITSAATGFAVQKKHLGKDLRVDVMAGRGQAGLMLSGRF
jgi:hypothetical protein